MLEKRKEKDSGYWLLDTRKEKDPGCWILVEDPGFSGNT
jgi:hypothetical protein